MNKSRGACGPCRIAHTACDGQRPCRRCTTLGKDEDCVDIERKRPGRPKGGKSKSLENGLTTISIKKARLDGPASVSGAAPTDSAPGTGSAATAGPTPTSSSSSAAPTATKQESASTATQPPATPTAQSPAQPTLRPLRQTPVPPARFPNLASAFTPLAKVAISLPPLSSSDHPLPVPKFPLPPFNSTFASSASAAAAASSSSTTSSPSPSGTGTGTGAQPRQTPLATAAAARPFLPNFPPPPRVPLATSAGAAPMGEGGKPPRGLKDADAPMLGKAAADLIKANSNPYLESLLSFLVEEVKDLKQTNASMKDEFRRTVKKLKNDIGQLQETQHRMDKERRELEDRLAALSSGTTPHSQPAPKQPSISSPRSPCATSSPSNSFASSSGSTSSPSLSSSSSSSSSSASTTTTTSSSTPTAVAPIPPSLATSRVEILSSFPFLSSYNLASNDVPFVVNDLNKPFLAVRTMDAAVGEEGNPPMVIAANPPFCQLMNYSLHELLGCPLSKIIVPDEKIKKQFLPVLYNRRSSSLISDIVPLSPLCVPKDGKMIRLSSRIQLFFSENGVMRWTVTVIEGIEEAPASAEAPMTWMPGLPKWWSAYSNMASSGPLPLATLRASLPPNNRVSPSQSQPGAPIATASTTTNGGGDAHSKDPAAAAARTGGAQVTGKRKLGDRSYDLGELLSNFAAPIPSPPVGTGDFAWLLKDGVGGGLVYAGSAGGQRGGPLDSQQPWFPDFSKKAPLSSSSGGLEQLHHSPAVPPPGARGGDGGGTSGSPSLEHGLPRLGSLKPWREPMAQKPSFHGPI